MAQTAQVLERPSGTLIEKSKRLPLQDSRPARPILYLNGNGIDPPHDWIDDPLEALRRPRGPYTINNADEYLDTEPVELYNGWLVRQEMSDLKEKGFEGRLQQHVSGAMSLLRFGQIYPDQMECLLSDGTVIKPDLSMISWDRLEQCARPYGPNNRFTLMGSPEFVIEVRSPSNSRVQDRDKRKRYFDNGAEIIWDIDEKEQIIYVYRVGSQHSAVIYTIDDEIDCEPLLPGWRRQVSDLFEEQTPAEVVFSEVHEDGKQIGREEGEKIGKQDMLIRLLQARFPDLSEQILEIIKQAEDISQLDSWFNQALTVQSLDELALGDGSVSQ